MELITLKPEQYPILKGFPDQFIPDPRTSVAIVAADEKRLAGRIFLISPAHIEGPFLFPQYRSATLLKLLIDKAAAEARKAGIKKLFAYGASLELADYLKRLGFKKQPLTVWAKEIS